MREGWEMKKLGEVCEISTGKWDANHGVDNGKYRFFTCAYNHAFCDTKRFAGESLILPGNGVNVGEVFYYDGEFDAYQRTYVISQIKVFAKYLYYHMLCYWKERNLNKQYGSATNFLKIKNFTEYELSVPTLSEQQQIVSILDKTFAAIDEAKANTEKNLNNAKELFQSQLNKIFSEKGESWAEKKLEEVIKYDKTVNRKKNLPYVGLENIESNTGKFIGTLEPQVVKSSTFYFTADHILYGRLRPYLNKVLLPDFEGHCSTEIFPILVSKEINKAFLYFWLMSGKTVERINATWTGARMPRANMNAVLDFTFGFPSLKEQQKIVSQLNALSSETKRLAALYQQKLVELEDLKKSILEKAFKGELTEKEIAV